MNPVLIDLGIIKIYWYSIMILLGVFVGGSILLKESKRFKIPEDYMINLITLTLIVAIIGARIYYVAFDWNSYKDNLLEIFKIWEGGLAIHGGLIAGLLFIIFYTKKYKVNTLRLLDMIVVGVIIGQAIGRWGNFFNLEVYGKEVSLDFLNSLFLPQFIIDGMKDGGVYHHPLFLYESLWCLIGFILLLILRRRYYNKIGQTTALYMIWYGVGRFIFEGMRDAKYILMIGNFSIAQIVSVILVLSGILLFIFKSRGSKLENRYNDLEKLDNIIF